MKMSSFIIVMILVGVIIISLYAFEIDLASESNLNVEVNTSYANTYDKVTELMNETNRTQTKILDILSKEDKSFFTGTWDVFTITKEVVFGVAKLTGGSIEIAATLLGDFGKDMSLPAIVNFALITIITILVIGALIFLLIKRKW